MVGYIRIDLTKIGWEDMDSIDMAQDNEQWRVVVNMVNEPSGSRKVGEFLDQLNDY
jgi:hypothetical protein